MFEVDQNGYKKILSLYRDAELLTKEFLDIILNNLEDDFVKKEKVKIQLTKEINCLFPEDFIFEGCDLIDLYSLKSYKWLIKFLEKKEGNIAYFGELSSELHNVFIKDPRAYRKDIKIHLQELYSIIKILKPKSIVIEKMNYSEFIKLIND